MICELPGRPGRIRVDPGRLLDAWEEDQVRVTDCLALQTIRQAGLPPDKVLHQPERRCTKRVILPDALHLDW